MHTASRPTTHSPTLAAGPSTRPLLRVRKWLRSGERWWPPTPIVCPPACDNVLSYACSGVSLVVVHVFGYCPDRHGHPQATAGRLFYVVPTAYGDRVVMNRISTGKT